ncbi:MAG: hypothetical protein WC594_11285, partial [Thermodesulfovibrionales bacterium]
MILFDTTKLKIQSLKDRAHDLDMGVVKPIKGVESYPESMGKVAQHIVTAKGKGKKIVLMI